MSLANNEVLIQVKGLEKHFKHVQVLKGIDIDIHKGEVVAVIGPSGSGKSTFLRCLNLLEQPTGGHIIFEGSDLMDRKTNINALRQKMGMVFQSFNLFANMTVLKNMTVGPMKVKGMKQADAEKLALDLLGRVGLADRGDAYPIQLSGGQQQRVAIARALVNNPKMIIADEPTGNLDPHRSLEIMMLLERINDLGTTVLVVTHEKSLVNRFTKRVVAIEDGRIINDETGGYYNGEKV